MRDEHFSPAGGADSYEGYTYSLGVRYVPPVRLDEAQLVQLVAGSQASRSPSVVVEGAKPSEGELKALVEPVLGVTSYTVAAALLALAVLVWVWRRQCKTSEK